MKKSAIVLFFIAFLSVSAFAQNIQEGISHLYAERYESAKSTFQKLLAANPNNIEAVYWLGQTHLFKRDVAAARSVYEKALMTNGNAPLLMVGMGQVELFEGKKNEARARFENAINASKGRKGNDPDVLNAIGRANVQAYGFNKTGDLDYAIAKLTEATDRDSKNPDIFINLGNAYRFKGNMGGQAITAYRKAMELNPNSAMPHYRQAMLYKTQVNYYQPEAWTVVLENLNAAVAADPKFAPAYEQLYYYTVFAKRDFAGAEDLANKIISNSDPSIENDYYKFQTLLLQKKYTEAAASGKNIIAQSNNDSKPRVYRAMTDVYLNLKDSATACQYIDEFFAKASQDDILGTDYLLKAYACANNDPDTIWKYIKIAVSVDSVLSSQVKVLRLASTDAKNSGQRTLEGLLNALEYQLRKEKNSPTDPDELISRVVLPLYFGGAYEKADSISGEYIKSSPDSIYGYYWRANAQAAIDTGDQQQGTYVTDYEKVLDLAQTDTLRFATMGTKAASSLAIYYANIKKDYPKALEVVNEGLMVEASNANLLNIKKLLEKALNRKPASSASRKTNSSSGEGSSGKAKSAADKSADKNG
jgi:tetratricopeptide (TPR) repeat protein